LFFPGILALTCSSLFWLGGFSFGLLLHTLAALVWAGTAAVGHAFFGWRLPPLRLPERPSSEKRE
jgi:hypothetical protein